MIQKFWEQKLLFTRPLIILGVFATSLLIALLIKQDRLFLILVALSGILALVIFLIKPVFGLSALLISSQLIKFKIGTGTETGINAAILLAGLLICLWLMDMIVRKREVWLIPSLTLFPSFALLGASILSFIIGQLPWFSVPAAPIRAQLGGVAIFVLSIGVFLLVANQVREIHWLERLTWIFLLLGIFHIVVFVIIQRLFPQTENFFSPFFNPAAVGALFWVWLVSLSFSLLLFDSHLTPAHRLLLVGLLIGIFFARLIIQPDWLSGWFPPLVAVAIILFFGKPRTRMPLLIAGSLVVLVKFSSLTKLVLGGGNLYSLDTRLAAWRILYEIIKVNPITGLGPANYYWYTPLFNILGYYVKFNSHNNYVDLIAQTGILGLISFLWFFSESWRLAWRLRLRALDGFPKAYVYACLGGIGGTLIAAFLGDWVLPFVYNIGFDGFRASMLTWFFLGGLVVLDWVPINKEA